MPGFRIFRNCSDSFVFLIHDLDLVARFYLILSNSLMSQVVSQCCLLLPACSFILCPHYGRRCAVPSITLLWVSSNAALNKTIGTNFIFQFLKMKLRKDLETYPHFSLITFKNYIKTGKFTTFIKYVKYIQKDLNPVTPM